MKLKKLLSEITGVPLMKVISNPYAKAFAQVNEEEQETYTATNKETGNVAVFKSKASRDTAVKSGSHEMRKDDKQGPVSDPTKKDTQNMFSKDTGYDAGGKEEPKRNIFKRDSDRDSKERLKKMKKDREEKEFNSLYYPDDFDEKVDSLKDKMSDKDFKEIKDAIENLKYMQYDLEDIDRDEDNEEWAMQSDAIDVEVEDLKGRIKQSISKDKEETPKDTPKKERPEEFGDDYEGILDKYGDDFTDKQKKEFSSLVKQQKKARDDFYSWSSRSTNPKKEVARQKYMKSNQKVWDYLDTIYEPYVEPESEPKPEPKSEPKSEPRPEPRPQPKPEPSPEEKARKELSGASALGFSDIEKLGSKAASDIDMAVRRDPNYTRGSRPGDDARLRAQKAKELGYIDEVKSTKLTDLLPEQETFTAVNKKSGKTSVFKSKDTRDAAIKSGTHSKTKEKGDSKKGGKGGVNIFNKDKGEPKKSEPKKIKSTSSEPDYDKYTSKAQTVTDFIKGDLSTDDIQKIADKNFGSEVATPKELDDFLNNKFIQGMMADQYGVDKDEMVSKVKELKAALFGSDKEQSKSEPYTPKVKPRPADKVLTKTVNKFSKKLGLSPEKLGKEEYEKRMLSYVHDALEDANFHSANRQIFADLQGRPELAKRPDYSEAPEFGTPEREEWDMKNSIYNKNFDASVSEFDDSDEAVGALTSQASWEGEKIIDALLDKLRKDGSGELADKIQTSFDKDMAKNESSTRLKDLI